MSPTAAKRRTAGAGLGVGDAEVTGVGVGVAGKGDGVAGPGALEHPIATTSKMRARRIFRVCSVPKFVELRRHTDNEGDELTDAGIKAALEIGARLQGPYDVIVSTGAQRATQTAGCFLAAIAGTVSGGVKVDSDFRSEVEDRWFAAASKAAGKSIEDFRQIDSELVVSESRRFGEALKRVFDSLPDGAKALVVGHSPMHEAAIYGLTGEVVTPLGKGAGVLVVADESTYRVEPLE